MSYIGPSEGRGGLGWGLETAAAAASAAFNPASAAGTMELWVRADAGVSGTAEVSAWNDRSGNARHLTQATNMPLYVSADVNGHNAIKFDGSNDTLRSPSFAGAQPATVFMVAKINAFNNPAGLYSGNTPVAIELINRAAPNLLVGDTAVSDGATVSAAVSAYVLIQAVFNSALSTLRINNGADASAAANFTSTFASGVNIGARNAAAFAAISVAEVVHYNTVMSAGDITNLQTYFNDRYALWA